MAADWSIIDTRQNLAPTISRRTKIDEVLLLGEKRLNDFCVAKRISWAVTRKTTRAEDRAYSLMGIFSVNMPLLYSEGHNAFIRLQGEIIKDSDDETLFAWESNLDDISISKPCGLLAPSPDCFANSSDIKRYALSKSDIPFSLTNRGIRIQCPLFPHQSVKQQ